MASGIVAAALLNSLGNVSGQIDWTSAGTAWRGALYTATGVNAWNFAADPFNYTTTNEHASTGNYTAGGENPDAAATLTIGTASGDTYLSWDIGDFAWTNATLSGVRGILIYADDDSSYPAAVGVDFGQDYAVTSGTFGVQWAAPGANGGVFYINLTP